MPVLRAPPSALSSRPYSEQVRKANRRLGERQTGFWAAYRFGRYFRIAISAKMLLNHAGKLKARLLFVFCTQIS